MPGWNAAAIRSEEPMKEEGSTLALIKNRKSEPNVRGTLGEPRNILQGRMLRLGLLFNF